MFVFSLLCYRSILGAVFMLPFSLLLESGKWKELDKHALGWLFINAFVGYSLPMALYYNGLHDTTASYGVISSSLTPLFTFVLSILLGWFPNMCHRNNFEKGQTGLASGMEHSTINNCLLGCTWHISQVLVKPLCRGKARPRFPTNVQHLIGCLHHGSWSIITRRKPHGWELAG
uniref:WAT1-related protein n=1 Tax=Triticum urartu TaxID=4572 RepID=A0A8R7PLA9_TRIUA